MQKRKNPLTFTVLLFLLFLITIHTNSIFRFSIKSFIIFFTLTTFFLVVLIFVKKQKRFILNTLLFFALILLFLLRVWILHQKHAHFNETVLESISALAIVSSYPITTEKGVEAEAKIFAIKDNNTTDYLSLNFNSKILLKIKDKTILSNGDIIKIDKKIKIPREKIFNYSYRKTLFQRGIYGTVTLKESEIKKVNIKLGPIENIMTNTFKLLSKKRETILKKLKTNLSTKSYSFLLAVLFGVKKELDRSTILEFSNTGMIHLLAISGLHIGFIASLVFFISHTVLSKSKALSLSLVFIGLYLLILPIAASSQRAFYMYLFTVLFFILGVKVSSITVLSLSGIIILFINPYFAFDLGFKFSFLATAGILLFSNVIKEKLPSNIPEKTKNLFSVTASAFLSVSTLQWAIFKKLPLFSLVSSMFVIPFFTTIFMIITILTFAAILFEIKFFYSLIELLSSIFLETIKILDKIPSITVTSIPEYYVIFVFLFIILYFYFLEIPIKNKLIIIKTYIISSFSKK